MNVNRTPGHALRPWSVGTAILLALYALGIGALAVAAVLTFPPPGSPLPAVWRAFGDPGSWWPVALVSGLGGAAFATFAWPRRHEERSFSFYVTGGLGLSTLVLGTAGSWNCSRGEVPLLAALGVAAGLLVGNAPSLAAACDHAWPPALQLAAILGPSLIVLAAVGIVVALFRAQFDRFVVRYARALTVVIGLSDDAVPLLRRLRSDIGRASALSVIVEDAANPLIRMVRTLGARVVIAHPDPVSLQPLLLHKQRFKVRTLYVIASDVSANLDWARLFRDVADASRTMSSEAPPKIIARVDDPWQAEYWRRTNAYRTPTPGRAEAVRWVSDALSIHEVTAALLVHRVQAGAHDRLVLIGQTPLSLAVCAELAQRQREDTVLRESSRPSFDDLVLVGRQAAELLRQHQIRQERFGNAAASDAFTIVAEEPSGEVLAGLLADARHPALIFTSLAGEHQPTLSATLLAALHPSWTIYEPDPFTRGLAVRPVMEQLFPFGPTIEPPEGWPVDSWERAARVVHQRFLKAMGDQLNPSKPSHRPWEELSTFYRESNTRLVTTTLAGAESVGRTWGPLSSDEGQGVSLTVSRAHLTAMAVFEHESWRRFYADNGWRYGPERDDQRRVHNALLPWDELSDYFKELTIDTVRSALGTLNALGYRSSVGSDRPWETYVRSGEVTAEVLSEAWSWTTASGDVLHARPGDVRVTGDDGDSWSVDPVIFSRTYERVLGDRWRRIGTVQAQPAEDGELVLSLEGPQTAQVGDWIVRGTGGDLWTMSEEHFRRNYTLA